MTAQQINLEANYFPGISHACEIHKTNRKDNKHFDSTFRKEKKNIK